MQTVHDTTRPGPAVTWFSDLVVTTGGIEKAGSMEESSDLINNAMSCGSGSEWTTERRSTSNIEDG